MLFRSLSLRLPLLCERGDAVVVLPADCAECAVLVGPVGGGEGGVPAEGSWVSKECGVGAGARGAHQLGSLKGVALPNGLFVPIISDSSACELEAGDGRTSSNEPGLTGSAERASCRAFCVFACGSLLCLYRLVVMPFNEAYQSITTPTPLPPSALSIPPRIGFVM